MRKEKIDELKKITESLKTVSIERVERSPKFLGLEVYKCELNNGKTIYREKVIKQGKDKDAVVILPVTKDNNVIVTVEPRTFTETTVGIGLPAGYIEKYEDPYTAALRELEEEIGAVPKELIQLGKKYYYDPGCMGCSNTAFLALGVELNKEQNLDPGEFIKYIDFTYEEALELIDMGYISDVNAHEALGRAKKYMKRGN